MIDRDRLQSVVMHFREVIEPLWSEETAYRVSEIIEYGPFVSGGQCAVTCLVLKDVLTNEFPDVPTYLVSGQLQTTNGENSIRDHSWLKIGGGSDAIIIDPTADQAAGVNKKVVIGTNVELKQIGLLYVERGIESDYGEQEHPKRFKRYLILRGVFKT